MNGLDAWRAGLYRWQADLAKLETECEAEGWTDAERLLFLVQGTVTTYHRRELTSPVDLLLPGLSHSEALDALSAFTTIIGNELETLVDQLDEIRRELIGGPASEWQQVRAAETLAAIRALSTVVLRFGREVKVPG